MHRVSVALPECRRDAKRITGFYRARWTIEQLFRTMKTKGFDIEAVRVAEDGPFENLTGATLIAAIQVLQLVRERDGGPAGRLKMYSIQLLSGQYPNKFNRLSSMTVIAAKPRAWMHYFLAPARGSQIQAMCEPTGRPRWPVAFPAERAGGQLVGEDGRAGAEKRRVA
jgi:hypothetical protein